MSGWWVVLGGRNDGPRVRCDRPEHGNAAEPWAMAQALHNLYCPDWGTDLDTNELDDEACDELGLIMPKIPLTRRYLDGTYCHDCGGHMFVGTDGVAHHGKPGEISHRDDLDHDAIAKEEK